MTLTQEQLQALNIIKDFIVDDNQSVFILKGYAGTGKTTLIKSIIPLIQEKGESVLLMAPTGRAAKVLSEKTGHYASTIHRGIYAFDKLYVARYDENGNLIESSVTDVDKKNKNKRVDDIQFFFKIKEPERDVDPSKRVLIIDEASMISSRPNYGETYHFGTDILIDDLLTYAQTLPGGKIIFVGDPAQLPPVGDNRSVALDETFFKEKNLTVKSYQLAEVLRQGSGSMILKNAMKIRDLLNTHLRNQLLFERKKGEVEDILREQVVDSFYKNNPEPNIGDSIILCYTNALVKEYNDALRCHYFPNNPNVEVGDILQVVHNIVNEKLNIEFYNGDFVRVVEVSDKVEKMSAPVYTDVSGERKKVIISINFRDVVLLSENGSKTHCKIIDDFLNSRYANLTPLQSIALYINFIMRHPELKKEDKAFRESLLEDPYFNAVQVKYGYAITVHKSQGGEWDTVYVDYSKRTGLKDEPLRWCYTATTRAGKMLYGVNMPSITPMTSLKFGPINKINDPSKDAFEYADCGDVVLFTVKPKNFQKQKYFCVKEQLDAKGFFLKSIKSIQYCDKYTIELPSRTMVMDCYYNAVGQYTKFIPESLFPENETLMAIFENEDNMQYKVDYKPSNDFFKQLYARMSSLCDDLNITITNIVEYLKKNYIAYYLKTSGRFSQIQFFFKNNYAFTYATSSSDIGIDDEKLAKLIQAFK